MDNGKSLRTSLFQREAIPLFEKEGPGEISNDRSKIGGGAHELSSEAVFSDVGPVRDSADGPGD
jgi:hypothetical protein